MSKQVVRFSVRVCVEEASGVGGCEGVVVEWKRGKHHGCSASAAVRGSAARWSEPDELLFPCTMYFLPKKRQFEEKSLSLVLVRSATTTTSSSSSSRVVLGHTRVALETLAADTSDTAAKSFRRRDTLEGGAAGGAVVLEYTVTLRRLVDPRDKGAAVAAASAVAVSSSASSSPAPVRSTARAAPLAEEQAAKQSLAESPLQSIDSAAVAPRIALSPEFVAPSSASAPRKGLTLQLVPSSLNNDFGAPPPALAPSSAASSGGSVSTKLDKDFGYASSGGIPLSARSHHERTGSVTPSPLTPSLMGNSSGHSRGGGSAVHHRSPALGGAASSSSSSSSATNETASPGLLQRSSEFDVSGLTTSTGSGGGSSKPSKKSLLGGAGHRRGKSHAVTPDELRGLAAGGDIRQQPQFAMGSVNSSGASRKSNAAKVASKLGFSTKARSDSRGSLSSASTPLSPRGFDSDISRRSNSNTPDFLIVDNMSESSSSSDFEEEVIVSGARLGGGSGQGGSPARGPSSFASPTISSLPSSPMAQKPNVSSEHREQIEFYQRQLADHGRRRDQSYVLQHFVAFCQPAYSKGVPVSAWVLFRCLAEWDCFSNNDGREFREQLLEGFEQLSKNVMDQHHQLYWMSTLLALLFLLRNKLRPLPRSDVQRNTALTVFQERLRGLASALCSKAALQVVNDLRPLVSPALLEHAMLEDAALTPSRGGGGANRSQQKEAQPRVTLASVLNVLEGFRSALSSAFISPGVAAQIMSRVAHGLTAVALNTLLDNNPRLCTFSNGLQMKKPVTELRSWLSRFQLEAAVAEIAPLEEIVNVLCMNKGALVEAEVRKDVCPHLTSAQLGQLLLLYTPDSFDSEPIHPAVLAALCGDSQDFKTDVEVRLPFAFDLTQGNYDLVDIEIPKAVSDQPSLAFLSRPYAEDDSMSDAW